MVASIFPQGSGNWSGHKFVSDFVAASASITSACASASGWESVVHDAAIAAGPCVLSYVWDQPSGWIWVCSAGVEQFDQLADKGSRAKAKAVDGIRSALGDLIFHAANGAAVDLGLGESWEQALASALAAYAGTTQTWALADGFPAGGHFIVLHYRKTGQRAGMLRPFALPASASAREVLPVDKLRALVGQVVTMDRARHPSWFA